MELSKLDRRILNILQHNNRITNVALAEEVGLSPPACLKRVKQLRESQVITKDVAILDAAKAGIGVTMIVEVEMERDSTDLNQHFIKRVKEAGEVNQCYQVCGEVDFVLIVNVVDMTAFKQFADRVLYTEPNMRKFRTLISTTQEKFTTAIPL